MDNNRFIIVYVCSWRYHAGMLSWMGVKLAAVSARNLCASFVYVPCCSGGDDGQSSAGRGRGRHQWRASFTQRSALAAAAVSITVTVVTSVLPSSYTEDNVSVARSCISTATYPPGLYVREYYSLTAGPSVSPINRICLFAPILLWRDTSWSGTFTVRWRLL